MSEGRDRMPPVEELIKIPAVLEQRKDFFKELWAVRTPALLEQRVVDYLKKDGAPLVEVQQEYNNELQTLIELFGDSETGMKRDLLFHGTGMYKYAGEKYQAGGADLNKTANVLENVLEEGLLPHHDQWLPSGDVHSTSFSQNYFYSRYYADKYKRGNDPLKWEFGDTNDWSKYFLGDTIKDETLKLTKKFGKLDLKKSKEIKEERGSVNSNRLFNWVSSVNSEVTPYTPFAELLSAASDIPDNFGLVLCFGKDQVETMALPILTSHELRTEKAILSNAIKAIIAPMAHKSQVEEMARNVGLTVPVLSLECADLHHAKFDFKDLVERNIDE